MMDDVKEVKFHDGVVSMKKALLSVGDVHTVEEDDEEAAKIGVDSQNKIHDHFVAQQMVTMKKALLSVADVHTILHQKRNEESEEDKKRNFKAELRTALMEIAIMREKIERRDNVINDLRREVAVELLQIKAGQVEEARNRSQSSIKTDQLRIVEQQDELVQSRIVLKERNETIEKLRETIRIKIQEEKAEHRKKKDAEELQRFAAEERETDESAHIKRVEIQIAAQRRVIEMHLQTIEGLKQEMTVSMEQKKLQSVKFADVCRERMALEDCLLAEKAKYEEYVDKSAHMQKMFETQLEKKKVDEHQILVSERECAHFKKRYETLAVELDNLVAAGFFGTEEEVERHKRGHRDNFRPKRGKNSPNTLRHDSSLKRMDSPSSCASSDNSSRSDSDLSQASSELSVKDDGTGPESVSKEGAAAELEVGPGGMSCILEENSFPSCVQDADVLDLPMPSPPGLVSIETIDLTALENEEHGCSDIEDDDHNHTDGHDDKKHKLRRRSSFRRTSVTAHPAGLGMFAASPTTSYAHRVAEERNDRLAALEHVVPNMSPMPFTVPTARHSMDMIDNASAHPVTHPHTHHAQAPSDVPRRNSVRAHQEHKSTSPYVHDFPIADNVDTERSSPTRCDFAGLVASNLPLSAKRPTAGNNNATSPNRRVRSNTLQSALFFPPTEPKTPSSPNETTKPSAEKFYERLVSTKQLEIKVSELDADNSSLTVMVDKLKLDLMHALTHKDRQENEYMMEQERCLREIRQLEQSCEELKVESMKLQESKTVAEVGLMTDIEKQLSIAKVDMSDDLSEVSKKVTEAKESVTPGQVKHLHPSHPLFNGVDNGSPVSPVYLSSEPRTSATTMYNSPSINAAYFAQYTAHTAGNGITKADKQTGTDDLLPKPIDVPVPPLKIDDLLYSVSREFYLLSTELVPYIDFSVKNNLMNKTSPKTSPSPAQRHLRNRQSCRPQQPLPIHSGPTDDELARRLKRTLEYIEKATMIQKKFSHTILSATNGKQQDAQARQILRSVELLLQTISHFLAPSGKKAAEEFPVLLKSFRRPTTVNERIDLTDDLATTLNGDMSVEIDTMVPNCPRTAPSPPHKAAALSASLAPAPPNVFITSDPQESHPVNISSPMESTGLTIRRLVSQSFAAVVSEAKEECHKEHKEVDVIDVQEQQQANLVPSNQASFGHSLVCSDDDVDIVADQSLVDPFFDCPDSELPWSLNKHSRKAVIHPSLLSLPIDGGSEAEVYHEALLYKKELDSVERRRDRLVEEQQEVIPPSTPVNPTTVGTLVGIGALKQTHHTVLASSENTREQEIASAAMLLNKTPITNMSIKISPRPVSSPTRGRREEQFVAQLHKEHLLPSSHDEAPLFSAHEQRLAQPASPPNRPLSAKNPMVMRFSPNPPSKSNPSSAVNRPNIRPSSATTRVAVGSSLNRPNARCANKSSPPRVRPSSAMEGLHPCSPRRVVVPSRSCLSATRPAPPTPVQPSLSALLSCRPL